MARDSILYWTLLLIANFTISSVTGQDCEFVNWTFQNKSCAEGYNEIYREETHGETPLYLRWCCLAGSKEEADEKREARNCRVTQCLTSTQDQMCSTLDTRIIDGRMLEYEEVMREPCTLGGSASSGAGALCCRSESEEAMLVTNLGAEPNEFPHQVKIKPQQCGGTIYNKRFVITASHCVVQNGILLNANDLELIVGSNIADMDVAGQEYVYKVKKIIPHEKYNQYAKNPENEIGKHRRMYNDIALLELEKEIKFSATVKSLEIAPANFNPFAYSDNLVSVGWGTTNTLATAIHLQKANFVLRQDKSCFVDGGYRTLKDKQDQLLCAGGILKGQYSYKPGSGDSGGPAICRKADGNPVLCGVTSFSGNDIKCANNNDEMSCVWADVSYFRKWIEKNAGRQDGSTFHQPNLYGKEVPPSKYQHQVHITSSEEKPCGGTLIQPDIVVTAAHCVMRGDGKLIPYSDLKVTTGVNNLKTGRGSTFEVVNIKSYGGFWKNDDIITISVEKKEGWVYLDDSLYRHDLAVLKLDRKTSLKQVKLPRLPRYNETFSSGVELAFPRNTTRSGQLRSRDYKLLDLQDCRKRLERISVNTSRALDVEDFTLCGVEKYSGGSMCDRESGGGLICTDSTGKDVLCGVQTFRMCLHSRPNEFADMKFAAEWVNEMIRLMK